MDFSGRLFYGMGVFSLAVACVSISGCSKPDTESAVEEQVAAEAEVVSDPSATNVLELVARKYKELDTFQSEGTITADVDMNGTRTSIETSFSLLLKKPNLYKIAWNNKTTNQAGTVWHDGSVRGIYMGATNSWSPMASDEIALGAATGISGGAAHTIPSYFLSPINGFQTLGARLIDPVVEGSELVGGDDCYVIRAASAVSKKETIWVSKKSHLICKCSRDLEPPDRTQMIPPKMTDEQLNEVIRQSGQTPDDETRQNIRRMMETSRKSLSSSSIKGRFVEVHTQTATAAVSASDFQFEPPEDATRNESIFGQLPAADAP